MVPDAKQGGYWHELGRPQVHGYDLLDAVFVDDLKLASIADEKVVRIFEAPRPFVDTLETLGVSSFAEAEVLKIHCPLPVCLTPNLAQSSCRRQRSSSRIVQQGNWRRYFARASSR